MTFLVSLIFFLLFHYLWDIKSILKDIRDELRKINKKVGGTDES